MPDVVPVTENVRRFAQEYLVDFKVSKAASRAGISEQHAYAAMRDPRVEALIQEGKRRAALRAEVSVDWVIQKLKNIAEASPYDYVTTGGTVLGGKTIKGLNLELTDEQRDAAKSIKAGQYGYSVDTHDKVGAVKAIGEYLGMFVKKHEVSGPDGAPIQHENATVRSVEEIKAELERLGLPSKMFDES